MRQWWSPAAAIVLLILASDAPAQERLKSTPKPDRSSMDDWCAVWKRPSDGRGDASTTCTFFGCSRSSRDGSGRAVLHDKPLEG